VRGEGVVVVVSMMAAAPRPAVWAELERIEDHVAWMGDATAIRFIGPKRRGVGTRFECDTKVGLIKMTDVMTVTQWDRGSAIEVRHEGFVSGRGRFALTDGPGPNTTIRWEEELHFSKWWGGSFGARLARPVLAALWRGNLRRLSARIEASPLTASPAGPRPSPPGRNVGRHRAVARPDS
jgi:hypothetical protein